MESSTNCAGVTGWTMLIATITCTKPRTTIDTRQLVLHEVYKAQGREDQLCSSPS